jgi:hypothetical protein
MPKVKSHFRVLGLPRDAVANSAKARGCVCLTASLSAIADVVRAACQTIPYVRQGRYLASLFIPVWRTTYNLTAGPRGMNANIDIQRQFCA